MKVVNDYGLLILFALMVVLSLSSRSKTTFKKREFIYKNRWELGYVIIFFGGMLIIYLRNGW